MTFLPIVERELRVAARGRGLHHVRFWAAAACLGYAAYFFIINEGNKSFFDWGAGQFIFNSLSYLAFFYCIIASRNTVDCISQEKREGTLGLLFLTDLKGYDVALGKLLANSLKSFNGVLAAVPIVCCALVMGGVSASEVWHVVLALLNIFFFTHATGLLISTFSRDARRANAAVAPILVFYFLINPLIVAFLHKDYFLQEADLLQLFDPGYAFRQASATISAYSGYWASLVLVNLNAWLFLAVASIRLPYCWQDKPDKTNTKWRTRFRQWCLGSLPYREDRRRRLLDINPFLWLISRNRLGSITPWAMLGLMGCLFAWGLYLTGVKVDDAVGIFVMAILVSHCVFKFWIAAESAAHFEEQRFSGALEYLLSCTPLSVDEIIQGQWLGLRRRFFGPIVALLVFDFVLIAVTDSSIPNNDREAAAYFTFGIAAVMAILVADALAIGWLGMWCAMTSKRPRLAAGQAIIRIVVLPWPILMMMGMSRLLDSSSWALFWWFFIGITIDVGFASIAKDNLYREFRSRAAVYQQEQLGLFGRAGRALGRMTR
jgi:ABC-2 family transporter protein